MLGARCWRPPARHGDDGEHRVTEIACLQTMVRFASEGLNADWDRARGTGSDTDASSEAPLSMLRPCLLPPKNPKFFKISCHIETLDACMEY